ncbi:MAG TPA: sigma-70 family RNA polymerase sigma factor [Pyrinomonadaceae bacterium]|nr:sigma-70 family RNA polymerase sigma factor [Pyrinomonadaceae bacterium]
MDEMADNFDALAHDDDLAPNASVVAPSDGELVGRAVAGDETAFEELFNRHRRRVALIASRFFRQREQIEEVVQESFMKAYFALSDFSNQQENSFASWIARIAFNACYDELRRMKRRPGGAATDDLSEEEGARLQTQLRAEGAGDDVEAAIVARDLAEKLLARLSPEDRLLLVMLDVEGLSVAEIGETNSWTVSKVKVRAHRARARLRRVLERFL